MTNDVKIVGRFCETPWRLTQTPYNVESFAILHGDSDSN
jgi:hypothetical protein